MEPTGLDLPASFESERFDLRCYRPGDGRMFYAAALRNRETVFVMRTGLRCRASLPTASAILTTALSSCGIEA